MFGFAVEAIHTVSRFKMLWPCIAKAEFVKCMQKSMQCRSAGPLEKNKKGKHYLGGIVQATWGACEKGWGMVLHGDFRFGSGNKKQIEAKC